MGIPGANFSVERMAAGGACLLIRALGVLAGLNDEHAVRLVHKLDLVPRQQPVLLSHGRRDSDLAFACNLHIVALAQAGA